MRCCLAHKVLSHNQVNSDSNLCLRRCWSTKTEVSSGFWNQNFSEVLRITMLTVIETIVSNTLKILPQYIDITYKLINTLLQQATRHISVILFSPSTFSIGAVLLC